MISLSRAVKAAERSNRPNPPAESTTAGPAPSGLRLATTGPLNRRTRPRAGAGRDGPGSPASTVAGDTHGPSPLPGRVSTLHTSVGPAQCVGCGRLLLADPRWVGRLLAKAAKRVRKGVRPAEPIDNADKEEQRRRMALVAGHYPERVARGRDAVVWPVRCRCRFHWECLVRQITEAARCPACDSDLLSQADDDRPEMLCQLTSADIDEQHPVGGSAADPGRSVTVDILAYVAGRFGLVGSPVPEPTGLVTPPLDGVGPVRMRAVAELAGRLLAVCRAGTAIDLADEIAAVAQTDCYRHCLPAVVRAQAFGTCGPGWQAGRSRSTSTSTPTLGRTGTTTPDSGGGDCFSPVSASQSQSQLESPVWTSGGPEWAVGMSGLHEAVMRQAEDVVWVLLLMGSNVAVGSVPAWTVGLMRERHVAIPARPSAGRRTQPCRTSRSSAGLGLAGVDADCEPGRVVMPDIRTLRDQLGRTAGQVAAEVGGVWTAWLADGLLECGE